MNFGEKVKKKKERSKNIITKADGVKENQILLLFSLFFLYIMLNIVCYKQRNKYGDLYLF